MGVRSLADAHADEITADGKGLFVVLIVANLKYPVACQPPALGGERDALVRIAVHGEVYHLFSAKHASLFEVLRGAEDPAFRFRSDSPGA